MTGVTVIRSLQMLRDLFTAPEELRPRIEPAQITEQAARHVAEIAQSLRSRGHDEGTTLTDTHIA
jgi:predicted nucleic acid-binding protein